MQHVNEPPPSVRERRPDVPPRLDAAVERALAKEPRDRFPLDGRVRRRAERLPAPELGAGPARETTVVPPRRAAARAGRTRPSVGPLILLLVRPGRAGRDRSAAVFAVTDSGAQLSDLVTARRATGRPRPVRSARGGERLRPVRRPTYRARRPLARERDRRQSGARYWTTEHYNGGLQQGRASGSCSTRARATQLTRARRAEPTRPASRREIEAGRLAERARSTPVSDVAGRSAATTTFTLDGDAGAVLRRLDHRTSARTPRSTINEVTARAS